MNKRIIYVLIGPPAVGKSTWINNMTDPDNTFVVNRDDMVESAANSLGWTYDDLYVFPPTDAGVGDVDEKYGEVIPAPEFMHWRTTVFKKVLNANIKVTSLLHQTIENAKKSEKNIVLDLTNMNIRERLDLLNRVSQPGDIRIAVIFKFKGKEKLFQAVAQKRADAAKRMGKSKTIPPESIARMINRYEPPSPKEKYDKIIYSDTVQQLKKIAGLKEIRRIIKKIIAEVIES
jgi:GTPase SAR1 family protein